MTTLRFIHWKEENEWLGYLEEYPDYWTQGATLDELLDHLKSLHVDMASGVIPGIRRVGEMTIS